MYWQEHYASGKGKYVCGMYGKILTRRWETLQDYKFAAGYCVEMYASPDKYPNGTNDDNYYAQIWIPVKRCGRKQTHPSA
ncbi:MAG: hypothetical protein K2N87_17500 [Eubacterium sp.]|nr:hypothetical protein [Eubacterium sp.]